MMQKMMSRCLLIILFLSIDSAMAFAGNSAKTISPEIKEQAGKWVSAQPVQFLENKGQMADDKGNPVPFVLFKASAPGIDLYLTEKGLTYMFLKMEEEERDKGDSEYSEREEESMKIEYSRIEMELKGASIKKENIIKESPSVTNFNYFYPHCPDGMYGVKQYEKITIKNIYLGIDWVLYNSDNKGFKYDFIVRPGADPREIKLLYRSANKLQLTDDGKLEIKSPFGILTENAPVCYIKETKENITSFFIESDSSSENETEISFKIDNYNTLQTLIVDPQLVWGTYYGGANADGLTSITVNGSGNVFIAGYTFSINFPNVNPGSPAYFQGVYAGGNTDACILKFTNAGVLLWATYYGGSGLEYGTSISADASSNVFITGWTDSPNFPTVNSGVYYQGVNAGGIADSFILKFNSSGTLLWATYYGGGGDEVGSSITTNISGNIFVTGYTTSVNFPLLNPAGAYSQGANAGNADVFILKFNNNGVLLWATYYGGSNLDWGCSVASDASGNAYITGYTSSTNFPVLNPGGGAYYQSTNPGLDDAFILKFNNTGMLQWATYYGGSNTDSGEGIVIDANGNIFVTGNTNSNNFPTRNPGGGAYFQSANGGAYDIFILKFTNAGVRLWATYYGGSGLEKMTPYVRREPEIILDAFGNIYLTSETTSSNFPIYNSGSGYNVGTMSGLSDVCLLQFNNAGNRMWATYNGGPNFDFGCALATDPSGCLFTVGEWLGGASNGLINPGGGAYYDTTWDGNHDSYIMKFCPPVLVLSINATSTNTQCNGQCNGTATATPLGGTVPYTYSWNTVPVQNTFNVTGLCPGSYVVMITDATGSSVTATVTVAQPPAITVSVTAVNTSCTGGNNGTAIATASGGTPGYTYSWSPGGATTQSISNLAAGTYSVLITDANGCTALQTVTINNSGSMTATSTSVDTCGVNNGWATAVPAGGIVPYTYSWSPSGGNNQTVTGLSPGTHTCSITDASGCTITTTVNVVANPNPVANAGANVSILAGNSASLSASGGITYSWTPATGLNNPNISNPTASPLTTTKYCVVVTDANGCTDDSCVTVYVEGPCPDDLYLPNAFSPNGDTENDAFCLQGASEYCILKLEITIYNRWGEKVYESNNKKFCWDGAFKDKPQNTAVFVYHMKAALINNAEVIKQGNISLIR